MNHRLPILSWAVYDFANTLFSAVVLTLYFPLYITSLTGANRYLGMATTAAMLLAGILTPLAGRISDITGKAKRYLILFTILCIFFTALIGLVQTTTLLILSFLMACFAFHLCLVFYNTLLPFIASKDLQGRVSGLGVGLGYLGLVCALPLMHWIDKKYGIQIVFISSAFLFLLFSLPLFFFVPERKSNQHKNIDKKMFVEEWATIFNTLKALQTKPKLLLFFGGNFFVIDAVNSTIAWFAVYMRNVFDPGREKIVFVMIALNASAFVFGILAGFLTDRIGAMKTFIVAACSLALLLWILTNPLSFTAFVWISLFLGSFALAGTWTAGRKALVEIAPSEHLGEYFGLYGFTTKISVLGSLFYGFTSDVAGMQKGLWVLVFPATVGLIFLVWSSMLSKNSELN